MASFGPPPAPDERRRSVLTRGVDLRTLVGCTFAIGEVQVRGMRLCEPCQPSNGTRAAQCSARWSRDQLRRP